MKMKCFRSLAFAGILILNLVLVKEKTLAADTMAVDHYAADNVAQWSRFDYSFTSQREYSNVLYDLKKFGVSFISPTGRRKTINGFWDGGTSWKVRFIPDEIGIWTWESFCSDSTNKGLDGITGSFDCITNNNPLAIYREGGIDLNIQLSAYIFNGIGLVGNTLSASVSYIRSQAKSLFDGGGDQP
ncbi:MAG: DUF5060 domain-containing protein, partial [Pedobacter sp.]